MLKLYRKTGDAHEYWEAWENGDGSFTVHWGNLGTEGQSKIVTSQFFRSAQSKVEEEANATVSLGFAEADPNDLEVLIIEFPVGGMGNSDDLDKRSQLESRMNEKLGWTGLGHCDGGSIGSGSMEVCCFVVDFDLAKRVISEDLLGTKFADYSRIYLEG